MFSNTVIMLSTARLCYPIGEKNDFIGSRTHDLKDVGYLKAIFPAMHEDIQDWILMKYSTKIYVLFVVKVKTEPRCNGKCYIA